MTIFRAYAVAKAGLRAAVLPESIAEYFPTATAGRCPKIPIFRSPADMHSLLTTTRQAVSPFLFPLSFADEPVRPKNGHLRNRYAGIRLS